MKEIITHIMSLITPSTNIMERVCLHTQENLLVYYNDNQQTREEWN